jgi:hypothetical protein
VGTVTTDKLSTVSIDVGGGGSKPGTIRVYDGSSTLIGGIGILTGGVYGGWFKVFGAGGTGYADAKVYTNTAGSLFIRDADVSISSANGTITTSPSTFDSTYTSIALKITQGSDVVSLVSRGVVFYYGAKIGSLVRNAGGVLELECGSGGNYVLINGTGGVRSDQGYSVGGTKIISSAGAITSTSAVTAAGFNPTGLTGKSYDIHFRDGTGRPCNLWINGVDQGQVILRFVGGVVTGVT